MQQNVRQGGRNNRAPATCKRSILRTIRLFFLQGWAWYRGNLVADVGRLAALFSWDDISLAHDKLASRRTWWFERDCHFHLRRQDGVVHLQRPSNDTQRSSRQTELRIQKLHLLTYNCQSLGYGAARLQELAEDMHKTGVTVAALQGTRWKSDDPRSEWVIRCRKGDAKYHCFSWGKPSTNQMLGVQLLVSHRLLQHATVHTRFDPPRGLHGRLGGLHVVSREPGFEVDELFITAYGPQERDDDLRQTFYQALLEIAHAVPKRTRVWLLGDFNAHAGADLRTVAAGNLCQDVTNNNGSALAHACESAGLVLANTYLGGGPTWWSPDGRSSNCIDFIAIPQELRSRLHICRVNKVLGRRWQLSSVRDHWPVEVVLALPRPWVLLRKQIPVVRWNKHALQVALEDPSVSNAFLRDCVQSCGAFSALDSGNCSRSDVEMRWKQMQSALHEVAVRHFAMRPTQRATKLLPQTFDLLRERRDAQQRLLEHADCWSNSHVGASLAWCFEAFRLSAHHSRLACAAKEAVKADQKAWDAKLEARLQRAVDMCDSRESWAVCRQLAGHGPSKVYDRVVPAARLIARAQWKQQLRDVWGATEHTLPVVASPVDNTCTLQPALSGQQGQEVLLKAAKAQARFRATPQGALPAELWQLLMQDRWLDPANVSCIPSLCMNVFECVQAASCNPQAWCDGQGCPLPKPGGVPGPNGQRIINLLDPAGKMFYKALFELVPDRPAEHQYGYAGSRSRREAILQVEAWLDRLHAAGYSTATTLFDLTKAFDTLASSSIEDIIQREQMPDAVRGLLLDLHRRLRISLKQADGTVLQMKLESGVLQGGGTGPRIFRMVYDERVSSWRNATSEHEITVAHNGHICSLSTAAYADDLVRIQHGRTLQQLEERTVACTNALVQELRPCNLECKEG